MRLGTSLWGATSINAEKSRASGRGVETKLLYRGFVSINVVTCHNVGLARLAADDVGHASRQTLI
jgi:hypothetical protein